MDLQLMTTARTAVIVIVTIRQMALEHGPVLTVPSLLRALPRMIAMAMAASVTTTGLMAVTVAYATSM
jgi:hypothetical protein